VQASSSNIGVVAIGRNEGERLARCLRSVVGQAALIVYVDSGSTDSSVSLAQAIGAEVISLDMRVTFTAARARNEGFQRLRDARPDLRYVQFVDGDCEVAAGWLGTATRFLESHSDVAVACGRRRELHPERSVYNWLCDIEWNTPVGEAHACGGDALMRVDVFEQVGRYRPDLIAGEEPELCVRIRATGWRIWRLDAEMTLHDAAMTRFSQWWRRALRAGYAYAQGANLHGAPPERHNVWQARRAWLWGIWLPLGCVAAGLLFWPWGWVMTLLIYPLQALRLTLRGSGPLRDRATIAVFQVLARFPEGLGQIRFLTNRLLNRQATLIEYK
jgi:glycosyltransferase involved in cell wall biosynthesis